MELRTLPVHDIIVAQEDRLLPPSMKEIRNLAESISNIGLLAPIVVTENNRLVAGLKRLRAVQQLDWDEVPCLVTPASEDNILRLMEIDENYRRHDMTAIERAMHMRERKRIYQQLYPQTEHGKASPATAKAEGTVPSFAEDAAEKTGTSARTVRRQLQIAEKLGDKYEQLKDTPLADRAADLNELAMLKDQALLNEIIDVVVTGKHKSLSSAKAALQSAVNELPWADRPRYEPLLGAQRPAPVEAAAIAVQEGRPIIADDGHAYDGNSEEVQTATDIETVTHIASDAFGAWRLAIEEDELPDETVQAAIDNLQLILTQRQQLVGAAAEDDTVTADA